MGVITEKRSIRASIQDVYAYRLDFMNLPDYNSDVTELVRTTDAGEAGAAYRFRIKLLGFRPWADLRVIEAVRPKRIVVEIDVRSLFEAEEVFEFEEAADGTNISVTITVRTRLGPLNGFVDRLFTVPSGSRQLRRELDLMAARLEA